MSNLHRRILDHYGKFCLSSVRDLEKTSRKIADFRNHLRFSLRCLKVSITPTSLRLKTSIRGFNANKIIFNAERKLLNERVRQINYKLDGLNARKSNLEKLLREKLSDEIFAETKEFITRGQLDQHEKGKDRQKTKFDRLQQKKTISAADSDPNWRSNSSEPKTTTQAKTDESIDIVTETESAIRRARLPQRQAEALRTKVATTLKVSKPPASNITREERTALKDLATNQDILILPADKGRCTVVLDREQYDRKDPTNKFKGKISSALKKLQTEGVLDRPTYLKLNPTTEQPPAFYGLPKIHKQSVPLRPIVSSIGSVTYELAGFLAKILGPLVGKSQHHVQNSADFVNKIKDIHVEDDETITSYDVCSLFTSIPPKEAVSVVKEALEADDTLADRTNLSVDQVCELLELCLGCTYFTYKGQFYQQMHGCAMGSPVSPIVVNLYMEKFENKALSTFNDTPPANWFRYVDDTWCRLKKRVAADFFDHINQIDDNIKFTQEPSHDNMLPFLDTKTIVEEDGNLRFEVYRKPTHTDQYLAFDSHHPLEHKLAVIKTLFHRADNIVTSDQAKTDEQRHLRGALAKCGYQNWTFNKALKPSDQSKKTQKCKPLTNKNKANITIPYVQGVSEKLRRIFQNFNIATNFKPHSTLRQRLVHPKDRPHKGTKANVIYRLKCEEPNCNNTYIGETSRPLKVRYKEHCRPSANGYSSAIFHHLQHNQGHSFKLESTDVLDRETRWWERGVTEAIYERIYNPTLNREGGLRVDLSGTWDLALPAPRTDNT
ncbi:hypothetical protein Bbelb_342950 [Branchiostoma belcheri]|nr:hypothetical protein Bbelb_342950 [Branchiostoma belcheri]